MGAERRIRKLRLIEFSKFEAEYRPMKKKEKIVTMLRLKKKE